MSKNSFVLLLLACIGIYMTGSFMIPLMDIDAAQYASISREMLARKSFLQVFDLGKDYLDKPPMLFWLSALSMKLWGVYDWAYRIPSLLFLGIALYATYQFANLFYSTKVARLATILLASTQAFFLIAHDVRTDTMLVGWVMLSIYFVAKWTVGVMEQKSASTKYFFFAVFAIAGGMMTKGPIALVVPVLAIVPYWVMHKQWHFFYKPIYIPGLFLLAVLLFPMSWGLYQQYDLHPGKLINRRPITSGLQFYYWTQSFGRYTGQNFYKEMGYFTFLLENMFWSFLPWIFVFLWALMGKAYSMLSEGFFKMQSEGISFFGFVLTYLVLSRSQAQLPHYIFVVFPLAAILTASYWDKYLWNNFSMSKFMKSFYAFHLFIFSVLVIAAGFIAWVPFGRIGSIGIISLIALLFIILLLFTTKSIGQKWFYISVLLMLGINSIMNLHFYPHLLNYQWGNQLAKEIKKHDWNKDKMVLYKIPNSNALHFYGQHIFPEIKDSLMLKEGDWVITNQVNDSSLQLQFPRSIQRYQSNRFHVTMLSLPFLMPATRQKELTPFELVELKK